MFSFSMSFVAMFFGLILFLSGRVEVVDFRGRSRGSPWPLPGRHPGPPLRQAGQAGTGQRPLVILRRGGDGRSSLYRVVFLTADADYLVDFAGPARPVRRRHRLGVPPSRRRCSGLGASCQPGWRRRGDDPGGPSVRRIVGCRPYDRSPREGNRYRGPHCRVRPYLVARRRRWYGHQSVRLTPSTPETPINKSGKTAAKAKHKLHLDLPM